MAERSDYKIRVDDKYGTLNKIDIPAEVAACTDAWFHQTLTTVNDSAVRLAIVQGEFHFHKHDDDDEFFLVLDGELEIDIEGQETVTLQQHQAFTVPKGVVHRTRAREKTVMLMMATVSVVPTGDDSPPGPSPA